MASVRLIIVQSFFATLLDSVRVVRMGIGSVYYYFLMSSYFLKSLTSSFGHSKSKIHIGFRLVFSRDRQQRTLMFALMAENQRKQLMAFMNLQKPEVHFHGKVFPLFGKSIK